MFGEVKIMKGPAGFELITDRSLLRYLLGNNTQTNMSFKIIFDFNVYFYGKYVKIPYKMKISMCMQMRIQDFFSKGQLCLPGGSSPFFRYIYYVNLVLNFPGARSSGPLGIFKLFIRSAHGIYLFVCNFM